MSAPEKGHLRRAFEKELRLKPEQCEVNEYGEYTNKLTHALWAAFKAGHGFTHRRGTFVVAEMRDNQPHFKTDPITYDYMDHAKEAQRLVALQTRSVTAVFQRISAFNPAKSA
jgi:hypothetical protein